MVMDSTKLWTKDFIIISGTNFFTHIIFYMLMVIPAVYTMTVFDANQGIAGLATGVFVIASLIARIFTGKYMEIIGRKKTLMIGVFIFAVTMGLHLVIGSLSMLFLLRIIQGAAFGMVTTTAGAVAADLIPDGRRGEGTGYYATAMNVAMAIGPFLSIFLYAHASFDAIFMVGLMIVLIDLVITAFLKVPSFHERTRSKKTQRKMFAINDYVEPKAIPISFVMFIITLAYASLMAFLPSYAEEINLVSVSSFFFIVYAAALLVTRPFTGKWLDLYGANKVTYPVILILVGGFVLLSLAGGSVTFLLSGALIGIGYGTVLSYLQTIAVQESPKDKKGLATSTFFIFMDLAHGIGSYVIGLLVSSFSFRMVYSIVALIILLSATVFYFVHGKKIKRLSQQHQLNVAEE